MKTTDRRTADDSTRRSAKKKPVEKSPCIGIECDGEAKEGNWAVVVRDAQGGEFCRMTLLTKAGAEDAEIKVRRMLIESGDNMLAALERWCGHVQVPLRWGDG